MSLVNFPHASADSYDASALHVSTGKSRHFRAMDFELAFGKREGIRVWDVEGKRELINCHVNGGTYNLGHRHPEVIKALVAGMAEVDIGNHHLPSHLRARLAKKLAETSPGGKLTYTVFGSSGGEAIDVALKVARRYTGRRKFVAIDSGYHGHTGLALNVGSLRYVDYFNSRVEDTIRIPFNDIEAMAKALTSEVAAVILETIPATGGIITPAEGYLATVREMCKQNGSLYIADEVQTGLGRMGHMWGVDVYGVVPDLLVSAKGLSGGLYPLTATLMTEEVSHVFDEDPFAHVSTCGGAEIGCLAGEVVIDITTAPGFLENVQERAAQIRAGLEELMRLNSDIVTEIRGVGLFLGIRFDHEQGGMLGMKAALDAGLLCWRAGNERSVLQFLPPLIITQADGDEILDRTAKLIGNWRLLAQRSAQKS